MKRLGCILLSLLAVACATSTTVSSPLKLKEVDVDGRVPVTNGTLVDINSTISIELDRTGVVAAAAKARPGKRSEALVRRIVALTASLSALNKAATTHRDAAASYLRNPTPTALLQLQKALGDNAKALLATLNTDATNGPEAARIVNRVEERLEGEAGPSIAVGRQLSIVADVLREESDGLRNELLDLLAEEGAYVQVGAWLMSEDGSREVHIPGFDDIQPPKRYEVERWSLALSDADKKQLEAYEVLAKDINQNGLESAVRNLLPSTITSFSDSLSAAVEGLLAAAPSATTDLTAAGAQDVLRELNALATEARDLKDFYLSLKRKYREQPSAAALLIATNDDLELGIRKAKGLVERIKTLRAALSVLNATMKTKVAALSQTVDTLADSLKYENLANLLPIRSTAAANLAAAEFGDLVHKHSLGSMPTSAELDLRDTGRREAGDQVVFKLAIGFGESKSQVVTSERVVMQRLKAHFTTAAGLVLIGRPTSEVAAGFLAAPAYSLFLKFGLRGWDFWNNVLRPGVGLNLSAPDFNRDGVPELGIAGTVSLVRDIIQIGFGYNVFAAGQQQWYWFLGLGLPLPMLGGGLQTGTAPK